MLREQFVQVQETRCITSKAIANISGISENQISQFRQGHNDISANVLLKLVEAMENISPGARFQFWQPLAGERCPFVEFDSSELSEIIYVIADTLKNRRHFATSETSEVKSALIGIF